VVTVTTHGSAEAAGSETAAIPAPSADIVAPTTIRFRLLNTVVYFLPHSTQRRSSTPMRRPPKGASRLGRY
jgi:hypothetical protein